jgi:hypothetical protein
MSPAQKVEFLKKSAFELSVDGVPLKLHRIQWYDQKKDMMYVLWWTTFDAGAFSVGWHVFYGYWHSQLDGNLQEMENTVSIEVLP